MAIAFIFVAGRRGRLISTLHIRIRQQYGIAIRPGAADMEEVPVVVQHRSIS
jgi:hypothetical protein